MSKFTLKSLLCTLLLMVGVNAMAEDYKLTISVSDFNSTSYAANNGSHTLTAVCVSDEHKTLDIEVYTEQVMAMSGVMQWQKSKGLIYNTTDLGSISSVTVNSTSTAGTFTTFYGESENPAEGSTTGVGYFAVKVGGATGKTESVVVVFDPATAVIKSDAKITAENAVTLPIGDTDEYTVSYTGDGELTVASSNEVVAEAILVDGQVLVEAKTAGVTTITISASETEKYKAAEYSYVLNVVAPAIPGQTVLDWSCSALGEATTSPKEAWTIDLDENIHALLDSPEGAPNKPAYNKDGSVRLYMQGNFMTLYAKEGYAIAQVELTCNTGKAGYEPSANVGTLGTAENVIVWNGFSPFVTITNNATSGANNIQMQIKNIKVTYVELEEVEGELSTVTVGADGYATFAPMANCIIGDGTVAKAIVGCEEDDVTLVMAEAPVVYEGEAVLLVGEGSYKCYTHMNLDDAFEPNEANMLEANYSATPAPVGSYVLQNHDGVVGFYKVEDVQPTVTANHAYLNVTSEVKAFVLSDNATAIKSVDAKADAQIFDLSGRKVNAALKGIYIMNGKKVVK